MICHQGHFWGKTLYLSRDVAKQHVGLWESVVAEESTLPGISHARTYTEYNSEEILG